MHLLPLNLAPIANLCAKDATQFGGTSGVQLRVALDDAGRCIMDSCDFCKAEAAELCHKMNCGQMPGFTFIGVFERD